MKRSILCIGLLITLIGGLWVWAPSSGIAADPAVEPLKFFRFQAGDQTFAIQRSWTDNYVLTANTNKAVTVPEQANYAVFSSDADIWVALPAMHGDVGTTAAVPSLDDTSGTGFDLNPTARVVRPGSVFGIISEFPAKVSIMFFK